MSDYIDSDFLHFDHMVKTGGTTLSDILKAIYREATMPGSDRSGSFIYKNRQRFYWSTLFECLGTSDQPCFDTFSKVTNIYYEIEQE